MLVKLAKLVKLRVVHCKAGKSRIDHVSKAGKVTCRTLLSFASFASLDSKVSVIVSYLAV